MSVVFRRAVPIAAILFLPLTLTLERSAAKPDTPPPAIVRPDTTDLRVVRLQDFLSKLHCPVAPMSRDFIVAADENQLDWRLLPSISVIESGGGKQFRNNNIFGWNQGLETFPSIRAGLHRVAFMLGQSNLYRHRSVLGKLRLYNPDEAYPARVLNVMRRISPGVVLNRHS